LEYTLKMETPTLQNQLADIEENGYALSRRYASRVREGMLGIEVPLAAGKHENESCLMRREKKKGAPEKKNGTRGQKNGPREQKSGLREQKSGGREQKNGTILALLLAALVTLILSAISTTFHRGPVHTGPDGEVLNAQQDHARKVEVTVEAPVKELLPDDTQGLPHQRFLIALSNHTTVLVAHDTKMAPHVPIAVGDKVKIHGEYIWNGDRERGWGVIHWTHHTDTPRHEGGWIELKGKKYE
jgi:hypothetical protein